jgi:transcriptional regulator with XRE-family HTH domain
MREPAHDRTALRQLVRDVNARLGAALRRRRLLAGLSQGQVARSLGMLPQQWAKVELGRNRLSAGSLILAIAELQLDPVELVEQCLDAAAPTTSRHHARAIPERLLSHLVELEPEQQRALSRFLGTVRPEPLPGFPPEGIAL